MRIIFLKNSLLMISHKVKMWFQLFFIPKIVPGINQKKLVNRLFIIKLSIIFSAKKSYHVFYFSGEYFKLA